MGKDSSFGPACFFAKKNYKLSNSVERDSAVLLMVKTILDTGAGPSLFLERKIDPT